MSVLIRRKNREHFEWILTGKKREPFSEVKLEVRDYTLPEMAVPRYYSPVMPATIEIFVHDYCPRCEFAEKLLRRIIDNEYAPYVKLYRRVTSRPLFVFLPGGETFMVAGFVGKEVIKMREGIFRVLKDWTADVAARWLAELFADERGIINYPITRIWDANMVLRKVLIGVDKEHDGMGYELEVRRTLSKITGISNPGREEELLTKVLMSVEEGKELWWRVKKQKWGFY